MEKATCIIHHQLLQNKALLSKEWKGNVKVFWDAKQFTCWMRFLWWSVKDWFPIC